MCVFFKLSTQNVPKPKTQQQKGIESPNQINQAKDPYVIFWDQLLWQDELDLFTPVFLYFVRYVWEFLHFPGETKQKTHKHKKGAGSPNEPTELSEVHLMFKSILYFWEFFTNSVFQAKK